MPDTSCRNCGTELISKTKCTGCRQSTEFFCPLCGFVTDKRIHIECEDLQKQKMVMAA